MLFPVRLSINPSIATPIVIFLRWYVNKPYFLITLTAILSFADITKAIEPHVKKKSSNTRAEKLPTVTVTATRIAADDIDTDFQTGHVTVISREKFEGDVATVADVLGKEAGIQVRQLGGLGSYSTVSIRGASSAQVNVFIDGVLLNSAYGGVVDLSQFPLGSVDKIEIYRGNVPIQLGGASIGGAINIKTLRSSHKPEKTLEFGYGSFNSRKLASSINGSYHNFNYQVSTEYLASNNDFEIVNNNQTPDYSSDDSVEKRQNSDFEQLSALIATDYKFDDSFSLQFIGQLTNKKQGIPELQNNPLTRSDFETSFGNMQLKLNHWFNQNTTFAYKFFTSHKNEYFDDSQNRIGLGINIEEGITKTYGIGGQSSYGFNQHLFNINLESKYEEYQNNNIHLSTSTSYKRTSTTLGVQDDWLNQNADLLFTFGVRLYHVNESSDDFGITSNEFHKSFQTGINYSVNDSISLTANASQDIRVPLIEERFGDKGYSEGNEDLTTERAINADVGIDVSKTTFKGSVNYYYRLLDDAIVTVFDPQGVGRSDNISKAKIHGLELESSLLITEYWTILMNSTFQNSKNTSNSSSSGGKSLPGLYEFEAFISNTFTHNSLKYSIEYQYQKGGYYDTSNTFNAKLPNVKQANFIIGWKEKDQSIELRLDNISDQRVQDFHRYPGPGRSLFATYVERF
jgi:iron complex outermembrane receptor protein